MSRSYKKAIFTEQHKGKKIDKRLAAKAVRRNLNINNGGAASVCRIGT